MFESAHDDVMAKHDTIILERDHLQAQLDDVWSMFLDFFLFSFLVFLQLFYLLLLPVHWIEGDILVRSLALYCILRRNFLFSFQ